MGTTLHLPGGDFRWYPEQVLQAACLQITSSFSEPSILYDALIFTGQSHRWAWARERSLQLRVGMVTGEEGVALRLHVPAGEDEMEREVSASLCAGSWATNAPLKWRCQSSHLKTIRDVAARSQAFPSQCLPAPAGPSSASLQALLRHLFLGLIR